VRKVSSVQEFKPLLWRPGTRILDWCTRGKSWTRGGTGLLFSVL